MLEAITVIDTGRAMELLAFGMMNNIRQNTIMGMGPPRCVMPFIAKVKLGDMSSIASL